jgi:hypothetical protein
MRVNVRLMADESRLCAAEEQREPDRVAEPETDALGHGERTQARIRHLHSETLSVPESLRRRNGSP